MIPARCGEILATSHLNLEDESLSVLFTKISSSSQRIKSVSTTKTFSVIRNIYYSRKYLIGFVRMAINWHILRKKCSVAADGMYRYQ
jgi:hypothetical protein